MCHYQKHWIEIVIKVESRHIYRSLFLSQYIFLCLISKTELVKIANGLPFLFCVCHIWWRHWNLQKQSPSSHSHVLQSHLILHPVLFFQSHILHSSLFCTPTQQFICVFHPALFGSGGWLSITDPKELVLHNVMDTLQQDVPFMSDLVCQQLEQRALLCTWGKDLTVL